VPARKITLALPLLTALLLPPAAVAQAPLTVYSSLPLKGFAREQTTAVVRGARLALQDAGGVAGGRPAKYVSLDDSSRRAGSWLPELESRNARRAAADASAVGYIGAFNSGASAISIPILNDGSGLPQISPSNTAVGLTRSGPGAIPGEPAKYYPSGARNYFRLVPHDGVQGGALAAAMRDRGCSRVALVDDKEVYGAGVGEWTRTYAAQLGLKVVLTAHVRRARSYRGLARRIRHARAQCFAYTGITANGAVRLFNDVGAGVRKAQLFGSDGIAESGFSRRVRRSVGRRVLVSVATLAPDAYPQAGRDVLARIGSNADPYALYGYEAMRLVIDAVNAVGPDHAAMANWLRTVNGRAGVIGTYGFDANGDTTTKTYGLYGIRGGRLTWAGTVQAP
jgi:branched-chain amino acid transport system substrate-binding protein